MHYLLIILMAVALLAGCGEVEELKDRLGIDNTTSAEDGNASDKKDIGDDTELALLVNAISFRIPDTGQTQSIVNSTGCDADHSSNPMSLTIYKDKVVLDNNTGLVWQRADYLLDATHQEAVDFCDALSIPAFSGWRLPTKKELRTVMDFGEWHPAIDAEYFPNVKPGRHWTSTFWDTTIFDIDMYYIVDLESGIDTMWEDYHSETVMCVQGEAYPEHFPDNYPTVNGDGTISGSIGGLMWQSDYSSGTWREALEYCNDLELAGHDDWRLPNVKEWDTMAEYFWNQALWTSSIYFPDGGYINIHAYQITFSHDEWLNNSYTTHSTITYELGVRCVRGPD